mgnify:CR=1 FL=1
MTCNKIVTEKHSKNNEKDDIYLQKCRKKYKNLRKQVSISSSEKVKRIFEYFKKEYLPEEFNPDLCKEGYQKWDYDPSGDRVCVGSTTELTVKGFSQYLEQIYAFGAEQGVRFGVDERRFA